MALTKLNARSATALEATILTGNLPANYNTETKYDELLEMENGKYKHSIWTQPTS